jgi:hypothetical protein
MLISLLSCVERLLLFGQVGKGTRCRVQSVGDNHHGFRKMGISVFVKPCPNLMNACGVFYHFLGDVLDVLIGVPKKHVE